MRPDRSEARVSPYVILVTLSPIMMTVISTLKCSHKINISFSPPQFASSLIHSQYSNGGLPSSKSVYWAGLFVILSLRMQSAMFFRRLRATDSPCRMATHQLPLQTCFKTLLHQTIDQNLHLDSVTATWTPSQQRYAMEVNRQLLSFGIGIRIASRCPPSQLFGKPFGGPARAIRRSLLCLQSLRCSRSLLCLLIPQTMCNGRGRNLDLREK